MKTQRIMMLVLVVAIGGLRVSAADAPKVTYQDHVLPILKNACLSCHNPDKKKGNLDMSSFTGMSAGGGSGKLIEPGDPDGSKLMKIITWSEEPNMPPKRDKLPERDLAVIRNWIAAGAPENSGSKVVIAKPKANLAVVAVTGKPTGPVAMPTNLSIEPVAVAKRAGAVSALACSPWAPLIAVGGQKQIVLYHSDTLELVGMLAFPEGVPFVLKFSPNGSLLLAGGGIGAKSGKVVVFDVASGKRVAEVGEEYDAVIAADILPNQTQVALGTPLRTVKIYNTSDGSVEHTIKKHTDWVQAIAYSPDGNKLASGDRSGGLWAWEAKTARELFNLSGHKDAVTDACFRGDSAVLASASLDGTIKLWSMDEGKAVRTITAHSGGVMSVAFTHDGRLVSSGRDRVVKVWGADGAPIKTFEPFADIALKAAFTHDAARVVGGDFTGQIRAWNLGDAKRVGELTANPLPAAQRVAALGQRVQELSANAQKAQGQVKAAQDAVHGAQADLKTANNAIAAKAADPKAKREVEAMRKALPAKEKALKAAQEQLGKCQADAKAESDALAAAQSQLQKLKSTALAKPAAK